MSACRVVFPGDQGVEDVGSDARERLDSAAVEPKDVICAFELFVQQDVPRPWMLSEAACAKPWRKSLPWREASSTTVDSPLSGRP
jgi:hypothetical protein